MLQRLPSDPLKPSWSRWPGEAAAVPPPRPDGPGSPLLGRRGCIDPGQGSRGDGPPGQGPRTPTDQLPRHWAPVRSSDRPLRPWLCPPRRPRGHLPPPQAMAASVRAPGPSLHPGPQAAVDFRFFPPEASEKSPPQRPVPQPLLSSFLPFTPLHLIPSRKVYGVCVSTSASSCLYPPVGDATSGQVPEKLPLGGLRDSGCLESGQVPLLAGGHSSLRPRCPLQVKGTWHRRQGGAHDSLLQVRPMAAGPMRAEPH